MEKRLTLELQRTRNKNNGVAVEKWQLRFSILMKETGYGTT